MPTDGKLEFAIPQGWMKDGTVVGVAMVFTINQKRESKYRDTVQVLSYSNSGQVQDTLVRLPGTEMEQMVPRQSPCRMRLRSGSLA